MDDTTLLDAQTVALLAQRFNLVTEEQLIDCWDDLGRKDGPADQLVRLLERKGHLTPWQSSKLLKGDRDGYFLGGYRLLYKIASGSFGRVFRADDPRTGTIVAIKVLRNRWSEDPHRIQQFDREGKVGMTLRHPNIVQILAVNRDAATGQYYIVMEFVEGSNLRDLLAIRKKLDVAEALRIIEEAAAGLAYAYTRGLTHRDMKASNILLAATGTAKLVDFGLAELTGPSDSDTAQERTIDYAGLEKATGAKHGDTRSDIFFLGCVLFEMLCGRPPMTMTRDKRARMLKQRFDAIARLPRDEVQAPNSVFLLCEKMMALDPGARFQTPSQLLDAIRNVRAELTGESGPQAPEGPKTVFVVEGSEKLQDPIRQSFKELGYKVLLSVDATRALQRYQTAPYHALVIDAGSADEESVAVFARVLKEADASGMTLAGILILNPNQAALAADVPKRKRTAVLTRPGVTLKQLCHTLTEFLPVGSDADF
jgi:eukaryotic-like serine/threonine-protein kinase